MENKKTTIQISNDLWKILNDAKSKPNESFNEVIWKMIDENYQKEVNK